MPNSNLAIRLTMATVIAAAITLVTLNRESINPATLDAWLNGMGIWAPVVYIILFASGTVLFAPGALFALAGGAMFGPVLGTLFNLTGATIGASIAFLIARYIAGDWVTRKSGGKLNHLITGVENEGWRFVAFIRLVPVFPFNLSNYAFGLTRIPFVSYVVTSFITMAPGALAYTWLGYAGREALDGNASAIRYGLLALGLMAAIAFLPRLIKRMRGDDTPWISLDEARKLIGDGSKLTVLDVRGNDEFIGPHGHIQGAVNIPHDEIPARIGELQGNIIAVCRTDRRSAQAAILLQDAGNEDVTVLRGGMVEWNAHDFDVETTAA